MWNDVMKEDTNTLTLSVTAMVLVFWMMFIHEFVWTEWVRVTLTTSTPIPMAVHIESAVFCVHEFRSDGLDQWMNSLPAPSPSR